MRCPSYVTDRSAIVSGCRTFKEPRIVYRNLGNGKFQDVSKEMGAGISARHSSRGCVFGDYDNDGDIDVVISNMNEIHNMNEIPSLLRNDGGNQNNWIKVKLIGTRCNRTAIGAWVRVVTGKHAQMDEVHSGPHGKRKHSPTSILTRFWS